MKILILFSLALLNGFKFEDTIEIVDSKNVYIEKIDQMNFITQNWNLVLYMDMEDYYTLYDVTQNLLVQTKNMCNSILGVNKNDGCKLFIQDLNLTLANVNSKNYIFEELEYKTRIKRDAPLQFIGEISRTLFGTLSEINGKEIYEQINRLDRNQITQTEINSQQRSILETTLLLINSTTQKFHLKLDEIEKNMEQITKYVDNFGKG